MDDSNNQELEAQAAEAEDKADGASAEGENTEESADGKKKKSS